LLLESPHDAVRESFGRLLKTAISVTAKNEETFFEKIDSYTTFVGEGPVFGTA